MNDESMNVRITGLMENKLMLPKWKGMGRDKLGVWD